MLPDRGSRIVGMTVSYGWRGAFENAEVDALHAACFGRACRDADWAGRLARHSLGWVCARRDGSLVGFVNVAWDGAGHAFVLDTMVATPARRHGVGAQLVAVATREARAAGCDWLHVDFEPHLRGFYLDACGFRPTGAGLIPLQRRDPT